MRKTPLQVALIFLMAMCASAPSSAQLQNRIAENFGEARVRIAGNVHPMARAEFDQGKAADSFQLERMTLFFNKTAAQQAELDSLLASQTDPASPNFHKWLTAAQYASRFGVSDQDMRKTTDWLASQGFTIVERANSKSFVVFSGNAAQVRAAFGAEIHHYSVNGEAHFANASEPSLPAALGNIVTGFRGLNDFHPKARGGVRSRRSNESHADFTSDISGNHFIAPDDFATIYDLKPLYNQGLNGQGQTIAIMGQSDLVPLDIQTFRSLSGLPQTTVNVILTGPAPGVVKGDIDEANLDLQWAGAVAPNATLLYVNSTDAFNSLQFAINNSVAPIISISFGGCETIDIPPAEMSSFSTLTQLANSQGITVVGPSGDSGAADCDSPTTPKQIIASATHGPAVDFPASLPSVTGVGGTQLSAASSFWNPVNNSLFGSALSYIPETAWNETTLEISLGGSLAASGGGPSAVFTKPSWQVGTGVPADGFRDVPDLSFNAAFDSDSEGYLTCSQGSCVNGFRAADTTLTVIGGTSAGVPIFAGVVAILNQATGGTQGNINPLLYQLAARSTDAFHDITSGDNIVPCKSGSTGCPSAGKFGFSAGPGYDLVTGLGSLDIYNFVTELKSGANSTPPAADFNLTGSTQAVSFKRTSSGSVNVTVGSMNGFNASVSLSCSVPAALVNVTCTASPSTIAAGGSATVTINSTALALLQPPFPPRPRHQTPNWNWLEGAFAAAFGVFFFNKPSSKRKQILRLGVTLAVIAFMMTMVACGGGSNSSNLTAPTTTTTTPPTTTPPPSPVTATVVIQGTSGANVHIVPVSVTVN